MPKPKINLRFLLLALLTAAILAGAAGAVWFFGIHRNSGRYEKQGDAAVAKGDYQHAAGVYSRAIYYCRNPQQKVVLLMKNAETFLKVPVKTLQEGFFYFQNVLSLYDKVLDLAPDNREAASCLLRYHHQAAKEVGTDEAWQRLREKAAAIAERDPQNPEATRYLALALSALTVREKLDAHGRQQASQVLAKAIQAFPADTEVVGGYASWCLAEAALLGAAAEKSKAGKLQAEALRLVRAQVAAHPDQPAHRLTEARVLIELAVREKNEPLQKEALQVADELEKKLLADDQPEDTRALAGFLVLADRQRAAEDSDVPRGVRRATALLEHVLAKHPDHLETLVDLAGLMRLQDKDDAAADLYAKAKADRPLSVSPSLLKVRNLQFLAAYQLLVLKLQAAEQCTAHAARAKLVAELTPDVETLRRDLPRAPEADYLEGWVAFLKDDLWLAAGKAESADARFDRRNADMGLLNGKILARLGLSGAAAKRLQALVTQNNAPLETRMEAGIHLVPVLLGLRQFDAAMDLCQGLMRVAPQNQRTRLLMATILTEVARTLNTVTPAKAKELRNEAANVLKPLVSTGVIEAVRRQAGLYLMAGDLDKARALLTEHAAAHPADIAVRQDLFILLVASRDATAATAALEQLLPPSIQNEAAVALRQALADKSPLLARSDLLLQLALEGDDLRRTLGLYRVFVATNRDADAAKTLARAGKLWPGEPLTVGVRFEDAMRRNAVDEAEEILKAAERGRVPSPDLKYWQGCLALTRNRAPEAVNRLTLAVNERPSFVEAIVQLAAAQRRQGDLGSAETLLTKALELKPDYLPALQERFVLLDARQDYTKALECVRQATTLFPDDQRLFLNYLDYLDRHGDRKQALELRSRLAAQYPAHEGNQRALALLHLEQKQPQLARAILEKLLQNKPDSLENLAAMANLEQQTGQVAAGAKLINDYLARRGAQATLPDVLLLARYYRQANQADDAVKAYGRAAGLQAPKEATVTLELADWYAAARRSDLAVPLYREALARAGDSRIYPPLIEQLVATKQLDEAQASFDQWQKSAPRTSGVAHVEAQLLAARGKPAQARDVLDSAIKADAGNALLFLARAQLLAANESASSQAAVKGDLDRALQVAPGLAPAREMLATWFLLNNRADDAAEQLSRLVKQNPDVPAYRLRLAGVLRSQGRQEALEQLLTDSVARLPQVPDWHQHLADLHRMRNRPADAARELGKVYQLAPGPESLFAYAAALLDGKEAAKALAEIDKQPQLAQKTAPFAALRARALVGTGKGLEATAAFARAFDLAAGNPLAILDVAQQFRRVSTSADTVAFLEPRIASDTTGATALALAEVFVADNKLDKAVPQLESLRDKLKPDSPLTVTALWLLATSYGQQQLFDKAEAAYRALLKAKPDHVPAMNNLAYILAEELHRPADALAVAEKVATAVQPNDMARANVLDTLGRVQFLAGKHPEAENTLMQSIKVKSLSVNEMHLAEVLVARLRLPEAREHLGRARELAKAQTDAETLKQIAAVNASLLRAEANAAAGPRPGTLAPPPVPAPAGATSRAAP